MWFDAVFDADSEYHGYFAWKLNMAVEISKYECNMLPFIIIVPPVLKTLTFSTKERNFFKSIHTLSAVDWRFELCINIEEKFWNKRLDRFAREGCRYATCWSTLISWNMATVSKVVEDHSNLRGNTHFEMLNPNKIVLENYNQGTGVKLWIFSNRINCSLFAQLLVFSRFQAQNLIKKR